MPHVAIIGAGPAGSISAILLARAGWDVTLIEQHRFPRDKVCGECLSALGIDLLKRIALLDSLHSRNPVELKRAVLHAPDGSSATVELPRPMLGISRRVFDRLLLEAARDAGADLLQPARCESIQSNGRVALRIRSLDTNRISSIGADWVCLADGKGGGISRRSTQTGDFGIKAHFEDVDGPPDAIELFGGAGCYGGLARIENGRWNAAFSVPRMRLHATAGDIDATFAQVQRENRRLIHRLARARRVSEWLAAPLPRFAVLSDWPQRIIPVGNAVAAIEPIGGDGIALAMRSAELAAQALIESTRHGAARLCDELRAQYRRLWRTRQVAWRAAALAISSPQLANGTIWALDGANSLTRLFLRLVGKT